MSVWRPNKQPFCWQPKAAFRLIEEHLEHPDSAALVYLALTRIASNKEGCTFSKPIGYIAKLAYVGSRTVYRRLPELERIGLVRIERRQIPGTHCRDCNTYTLLVPGLPVLPLCQEVVTRKDCLVGGVNEETKKEKKACPSERVEPVLNAPALFTAMKREVSGVD